MKASFFITATNTGVGKTIVTAGLARAIKARGYSVAAMKPITSGAVWRDGRLVSEDAEYISAALGNDDPAELVAPILFEPPLAPFAVTLETGAEVDIGKAYAAFAALQIRYDIVLVEGIGGLLVPLRADYSVADLVSELGIPLVVVARPDLGTINHTALTVEYARRAGLDVAGVIFNYCKKPASDPAERSNPEIIRKFCDVPILGTVTWRADTAPDALDDATFGPIAEKLLSVAEISGAEEKR